MINFDSPRGGISLVTEKGPLTTSRLLVQKASQIDSGLYTCAPSNANPSSVRVHILNGKTPSFIQSHSPPNIIHLRYITRNTPAAINALFRTKAFHFVEVYQTFSLHYHHIKINIMPSEIPHLMHQKCNWILEHNALMWNNILVNNQSFHMLISVPHIYHIAVKVILNLRWLNSENT